MASSQTATSGGLDPQAWGVFRASFLGWGYGPVMLCVVCLISGAQPTFFPLPPFLKKLCRNVHSVSIRNCQCWKPPRCLQQVAEEETLVYMAIG